MRAIIAVIFSVIISTAFVGDARAQFAEGKEPKAAIQAIGGPVGSQTFVVAPPASSGIIKISQPFANWLQPYIDAIVNALILAAMGWVAQRYHAITGRDLDQKHRDALTAFAQRQASSLIADGMVAVTQGKITVPNAALATAANQAQVFIPNAMKHFGITPDEVANRVVDEIPRVAAGAQMLAADAAARAKAALP